MEILKFRTNLKCNGCIAKVTPYLDGLKGMEKWSIDLSDPSRILTAEVSGIDAGVIIQTLAKVGYKAEKL
jgi:copper chaperone